MLVVVLPEAKSTRIPARMAFREMDIRLAKRHSGRERRRTAVFAGYNFFRSGLKNFPVYRSVIVKSNSPVYASDGILFGKRLDTIWLCH